MDIELFNYELPPERIAQAPVRPRERAKLLYYDRAHKITRDHHVFNLPQLLKAGDLVVFNVTKVRHARISEFSIKNKESGVKEILILKPLAHDGQFECLMRGKNIHIGLIIEIDCGEKELLELKVIDRIHDSLTDRFVIQAGSLSSVKFLELLENIGHLPLPPYINNEQLKGFEDQLYQPVIARELGSVAAPTASLHFTHSLIEELKQKGVQTAEVVLHVGLGTFLPVRVQNTDDHIMHSEEIEVTQALVDKINYTKAHGGRVVAIGTTVVRALESAAQVHSQIESFKGETSLFIQPGYQFKVIDCMLTNFHMPKSTLLMMVSAFIGREALFELYNHALKSNYRFLSFGDCMLIV